MSVCWQAAGRYEEAAAKYAACLGADEVRSFSTADTAFIVARMAEAYAAVGDWDSLSSKATELKVL